MSTLEQPPPPFTKAIMLLLRQEVAKGAAHECAEWTDNHRRCMLCDRYLLAPDVNDNWMKS